MMSARLLAAAKDGDVATVRDGARVLLAQHAADADAKRLAACALMWCSDFAAALPHLAPQDHLLRARAHAQLGQLDGAKSEIGRALWDSCLGQPNESVKREIWDIAQRCTSLGQPSPWGTPKSSNNKPVARWYSLLGEGQLPRARARIKETAALTSMPDYEWPQVWRVRAEPLPAWLGQQVKHLVVVADCGNGDFFMFARYVTLARERCSRMSLVVEPCLEAIAKRCLPVDDVVHKGWEWPLLDVADAYASMRLGNVLLADQSGVNSAPPMQIAPLEETVPYIGPGEALHVGLCWSASLEASLGSRSIPFAGLEPLQSLPGVYFHSLQVGASANDADAWVARHELRTYDDTVSLIAALDVVVTVDTSVAHVAANLGKPVHLILAGFEDPRWGTGETTPWYPTMTIYRGDVDESVKRISERLVQG